MKIAIVVEAIPPYCGGGEQVAWIHAVEMARVHDVAVVTFGESYSQSTRDGVSVHFLPLRKRNLLAYSTTDRILLNECLDSIAPAVIHCHMPHILSACLRKSGRFRVSTIHDGVPESELVKLKYLSRLQWLKFKILRYINIRNSDAITCVSNYNLDVMRTLYPHHAEKMSFIPNPIYERFFAPVTNRDEGYILNFGRQIPLKMAALLDVARLMPDVPFVFVGTGEMVQQYGLPNVRFVGFSAEVDKYIDAASMCVFPSLSENFPLVGLEAMARGKPVIATRRGFSEYIQHRRNGLLLDSVAPNSIKAEIELLMKDRDLRNKICNEARKTAETFRPGNVIQQYEVLYHTALAKFVAQPGSMDG